MFPRSFLPAALLLAAFVPAGAEPPSPDSPEHQALTAAGTFLADEDFALREDYWKGILTTGTGRAVRLQFFKRNCYRLFLGVAPAALPKGARLHLHIFDDANEEVAKASGEPGEAAVGLLFENDRKSGLFLVLMGVESPPGPFAESEIPAALFYGWK